MRFWYVLQIYTQLFSGTRVVSFVPSLHTCQLFVFASSEGSGETAHCADSLEHSLLRAKAIGT